MRRLFTAITILLCTNLMFAQSDLVITAAYDGPLSGGHPKGVELFVINDIPDLSQYGIGSANNGGGTDGEEFTFPADAVTAGSYIYVAADSAGFNNFFGFNANYIDGAMGINGDDAIELFKGGAVVDVFGDINVDGTGEPWDHLDGWAYRKNGTGPDGSTFTLASWTFSGINALDGETTNATAANPIPVGTYSRQVVKNVTFQVDMSKYTGGAYTGVFVNGDFNGWCGSCNPMTDANGDGVWEVTLPLTQDSIEWKFTLDGWTFQENFNPGDPCTKTTAGFTNRFIKLTGDTTIPVVCWQSCGPCSAVTVKNVTFQVDLSQYQGTFTSAFINGDFNAWCGGCNPMTDANGDGVWDVTLPLTQDSIEYKFTLDAWTVQENFTPGDPCTKTTGGFTNRFIAFTGDTTIPTVCWEQCGPCAPMANALVLQGIMDFTVPAGGSAGKAIHVKVEAPIADLSRYGLGVANNGGGTDGQEYTFPAAAPAVGDDILVVRDSQAMADYFAGCFAEFEHVFIDTSGNISQNGDDAIELFRDSMNIETFGDVNVDGTGEPWEYLDSWAYKDATGTWTYGGVNCTDNSTTIYNSSCPYPMCPPLPPAGTPVYDIATVTTVDANGDADSIGVTCELRGVVTSVNFSSNPRIEFFFQDATGGIGLFESNNDYGYNPVTIGDSIHVQGTIGQFRGLIQINPDTLMIMGQGTVPAPKQVSMLDESTEGELIHLSNVTLADPAQWPAPGSSANVDIVVCGQTMTMRIDSDTDVDDNVTAPTGSFNLIGIGSQFDFSAPFTEGYQVFPRIASDIMPIATQVIADYKGVDANGEADSANANVVFEGTVTSIDYDGNAGLNFFMQDASAGVALFNFADVNVNGAPYEVMMGDQIRVHGSIDQFRGLIQVFVDSIEPVCQGIPVPAPMVVDSMGEFTEGMLIRINDAQLVDAGQWPGPGSSASVEILVGMDTLVLRIDSDTEIGDSVSAPSGTFDIIGVGSQFTFGPPYVGGYQIQPRMPADIIAAPSTVGVPCADLYISEYFEGGGNNKGFEIYNPTDNPIDLSSYTVELSGNGGTFLNSFVLNGTLASKDVYVVTTDQADPAALAQSDTALGFPSIAHFSGDDALYLLKGNDTLDIIGEVGVRLVWPVGTGSTQNHTLVRKANVFNGTTDWAVGATQWDVYPQDFLDSLGSHTQDDCGGAIIPELSISPATVDVLQYEGSTTIDVIIANPNNADTEVEVFVRGGTATNGTDFTFTDTTVTFAAGSSTPVNLNVGIINQPGSQPKRTVVLGLRNATNGATIALDSAVITIIDVPYYPIATVHGEDGDGVADSNGIFCELRGVVTTGIDFRGGNGLTFYMTDPTGSINVFNFSDVSGYTVTEGDSLHVIGQIEQFRGLTEIVPDSILVVSTGNAIPAPRVVSTLDENTESELVQLYGWRFIDTTQWDNSSFSGFNVDVTNGTDTVVVRIDNDSELYNEPAPDTAKVYAITGLGSQYSSSSSAPFLDGYQLFPRYVSDLEEILAPAAAFSYSIASLDVDFTDLSTNNPTGWIWDFGDGVGSIDQNPTHTYANGGEYVVCLTASNVAGNNTACDTLTVIGVGIDNGLAEAAGLEVYPNPTSGQLFLQSDLAMQTVTIVTVNGQVVAARRIGDTHAQLPLNIAAGTYFVIVEYEEGQVIQQIVKQ